MTPVFASSLTGDSGGSSEDEPLINLVKKRQVKTPQRKTISPKKQEEKQVAGKDSGREMFLSKQ